MISPQAARIRVGLRAAFAVGSLALIAGCGSGDVTSERQGGGGMASVAPVPWCDAYHVINCVCQQCHQSSPLNGATIPLLSYADTQAPLPASSKTHQVWQTMQDYVSSRYMPFMGSDTVMPPVQPLSDADYDTMLAWFAQGATDLGGQDCPMTCDWSASAQP